VVAVDAKTGKWKDVAVLFDSDHERATWHVSHITVGPLDQALHVSVANRHNEFDSRQHPGFGDLSTPFSAVLRIPLLEGGTRLGKAVNLNLHEKSKEVVGLPGGICFTLMSPRDAGRRNFFPVAGLRPFTLEDGGACILGVGEISKASLPLPTASCWW
jgi:hypothetical protein